MNESLKLLSPVDLVAQAAPVQWLWEGYLCRGMVTLLTSRWKLGKTTLIASLLSQMGRGGNLAGYPVAPGRAVVISEEPACLWQVRHQRWNFDDTKIRFVCRPFRHRVTTDEWKDMVRQIAGERPDLVVLDPFAMFLPGDIESHPGRAIDTLSHLHTLTEQGCAVVMLHHPTVEGPLRPRGTGAVSAFVDILVELDCPHGPDSRVRRLKCVSRLAEPLTRCIELSKDGSSYSLVPEEPNPFGFEAGWPVLQAMLEDAYQAPTRRELLATWLEDFEKPSRNTLIRWLERAEQEGRVVRVGSGRQHDAFRYMLKGEEHKQDQPNPTDVLAHAKEVFAQARTILRAEEGEEGESSAH